MEDASGDAPGISGLSLRSYQHQAHIQLTMLCIQSQSNATSLADSPFDHTIQSVQDVAPCRDLLYLDLALESAARSMLESSMADIKAAAAGAEQLLSLLQLLSASLEHACMAFASNQELVLCLKALQVCLALQYLSSLHALFPLSLQDLGYPPLWLPKGVNGGDSVLPWRGMGARVTRLSHDEGDVQPQGCWGACVVIVQGSFCAEGATLAMQATAAAKRLRRALADLSVCFTRALQPTAETLGQGLRLSNDAIQLFSEEVKPLVSFPSSALPFLFSQELSVLVVPASPGFLQPAL